MIDKGEFYLNYDLDSASYKYGKITGHHPGFGGVIASGLNTTVDAIVGGSAPFAPVLVGDYVWFQYGGAVLKRRVVTKPTNDRITVDSVIDLYNGTTAWDFLPFRIGTTDEHGWLSTEGLARAFVLFDFDTIADAVDVSVEVRGRAPGEKPKPVFDASYAAGTPLRKALEITELVGSVRLGVKAAAGFAGTNDLTASLKGHELR